MEEYKEYKRPKDCDCFRNGHCDHAVKEVSVPNRQTIYYAGCDLDCEYFRPKRKYH